MGCIGIQDNEVRNFGGKKYRLVKSGCFTHKDAEIVAGIHRDTHNFQIVKSRGGNGYSVYIREKPAHAGSKNRHKCLMCGSNVGKITPSLGQCPSCGFMMRL